MANPLSDLVKNNPMHPGDRATGEAVSARRQAMQELNPAPARPDPAPKPAPAPKSAPNPKTQYGTQPGEKRIDVKDMVKPLGSFKKGGKVPKTGVYKLHEGEQVVPVGKVAGALGSGSKPKKKGSGKAPHKMTIRKMDDNSFHVMHDHQSSNKQEMGTTPPSEEFTVPNAKRLTQHVRQTFAPGMPEEQ